MSLHEAIIDQEDREFTASLGSWTGDATWEAGPISGYLGLMDFLCEPLGPDKQAKLIYPNFKLPKAKDISLDILSGKDLTVPGEPLLTITLKDTPGTEIVLSPPIAPLGVFGHNYYTFTTPDEWDPETGQIIITASFPDAAEGHVCVDYISLTYLTSPDHLTFMGI